MSFEFGVNQRHTFLNHRKVRHKNKQEGKECQRVDETPKPTWVMKQNDKPKELEQTLDRSWENALFQLEYIQNTAELF